MLLKVPQVEARCLSLNTESQAQKTLHPSETQSEIQKLNFRMKQVFQDAKGISEGHLGHSCISTEFVWFQLEPFRLTIAMPGTSWGIPALL